MSAHPGKASICSKQSTQRTPTAVQPHHSSNPIPQWSFPSSNHQGFRMTAPLTVEQMEVIRRIRSSGATLQQIAEVYETLDRLEKELGSFGLVGKEKKDDSPLEIESPTSSTLQMSDVPSPLNTCNNVNTPPQQLQQGSDNNATGDDIGNIKITDVHSSQSQSDGIDFEKLPPGVLKEASRNFLLSLPKDPFLDLIKKCSSTLPTCDHFHPEVLPDIGGLNADEFQTFLSGEITKLGSDLQTSIIDWFSGILCQSDWYINNVTQYFKDFMTDESTADTNDNDFIRKRERFIFHETHLAVLKTNFKRKSYPSCHEKTRIANECNLKMAISCGYELQDKDRVNTNNVDGWFRNKRKKLFRKSKQDPSQPYPIKGPQKEVCHMEMKPVDIDVSQTSHPPNNTSPQHTGLMPISPQLFRPSISILSRSSNCALSQQQQSTAAHLPDHSSTDISSTDGCLPIEDVVSVKEEICSAEKNPDGKLHDNESAKVMKFPYSHKRLLRALKACGEDGASQRQISKKYGIPPSTQHGKLTRKRPLQPTSLFQCPEEEAEFFEWVKEMSETGFRWSKNELLAAVKSFLDLKGREARWCQNSPDSNWYRQFRKSYPEIRICRSQKNREVKDLVHKRFSANHSDD